jgi:TnpA family transposase
VKGVTSYTHVSDQHSTYGTQVIVSTERDATFTLDEILGNTTELPIVEHATDTAGQTLATFALFDLVGLRLSPRIAKLTDKQLWRPSLQPITSGGCSPGLCSSSTPRLT